ncbi:MAG: metallophosphoesterase [Myxococcota bacterium]
MRAPSFPRLLAVLSLLAATAAGRPARSAAGRGAARKPDAPAVMPGPREHTPARRWRIVALGDLNGETGSTRYVPLVHRAVDRLTGGLRPDLVISTGDLVAGQRHRLRYGAMWRAFHRLVTDPLARAGVPFAPAPGNHDASAYEPYAREREIFGQAFAARRPPLRMVDDAAFPYRYAYRLGPALFVALDATIVAPLDAAQRRWLERRLQESDAPVKIVYDHVPLRPFTAGRRHEVMHDPALEAVLDRERVDLFVSGHHHGYFPGRVGRVRYVSVPCLGTGARPLLGERERSPRGVVVIELEGDRLVRVDALSGEDLDTVVERADLPDRVGTLWRDDLAADGQPAPDLRAGRAPRAPGGGA